MKRTHKLLASIREWKDESGKTHKVRIECGGIFTSSSGRMSIRIEALPCTADFNGWLSVVATTPGDGIETPPPFD